jgi:hypothetical protein
MELTLPHCIWTVSGTMLTTFPPLVRGSGKYGVWTRRTFLRPVGADNLDGWTDGQCISSVGLGPDGLLL